MAFTRANFRRMLRRSGAAVVPAVVPSNTVAPAVTGAVLTGSVLTGSDGTWLNGPTLYQRQWQMAAGPGYSSWVDIAGATGPSFTLTAAQEGYKVRFAIRAQNAAGWSTAWAYSAATAVSAAPPNTTPYDYLVTSEADWDTVFALTDAQRNNKIIAVRKTGTPYAPRAITWRPANQTKIVAENSAQPPQLMRWTHDTSANLAWEDIQFVDDTQSSASNCTTYISRSPNWLRDNIFKKCGWIGNYRGIIDNPAFDPTYPFYPEYAGVTPTFTNGVLTGLEPNYVVGADGKAFRLDYVGDLMANGTGYSFVFNDFQASGGVFWPAGAVKPTATFDVVGGYMTNFVITNGGSGALYYQSSSNKPSANGYMRAGGGMWVVSWAGQKKMVLQLPGAFAVNSGTGGIPASAGTVLRGTWRYEGCYSRLCGDAFKHPAAEYFEVIGCQVQNVYQDAFSFGISEGVKRITILNNDVDNIFSADGHPGDPHADGALQLFFTSSGAGKRVSDIEIILQGNDLRNKGWENSQGIFLQTNVTPKVNYIGVISHNNILTRRQGNAVTIGSQKNLIVWRNIAVHYQPDNVNFRDFDPSIAGEHGNTLKYSAGVVTELGLLGKNIGEKYVGSTGAGFIDSTTWPNITVGVQFATIPAASLFAAYNKPLTRAQQLAQVSLKAPYSDANNGPVDSLFDFNATVPQAGDIPTFTRFTPLTAQPVSSSVWTAWTPILAPEGTVNFSATGNVQVADDILGTNATAPATSGSFATQMTVRKYMRAQIATSASAGVQTTNTVTLNGLPYPASATT